MSEKENRFSAQQNANPITQMKDNKSNEAKQERRASEATQEPKRSRSRGVNSVNGFLRRSMARRPTSVAISAAIELMRDKIVRESPELIELTNDNSLVFLPLDATQYGTEVSSILVVRVENKTASVVNLTLASTAEDLGERYDRGRDRNNRNEAPIVIPRVPSDVYAESEEFRNIIVDIVKERFPGVDVQIAGQMVIQDTVNMDDLSQLRPIVYRSVDATEGLLADLGEIEDGEFNLLEFDDNVEFFVRTKFGGKDEIDDLGNPIRQDVTLTVIARQQEEREGKQRYRTEDQVYIRGYLDATWRGQETENDRGNQWTEKNTQTYMPVFVITGIDTTTNAVVLPQLILGLMAVNLLAENNRWVVGMSPAHSKPQHFVGGLGREVPMIGTSRQRLGNDEVMGIIKNEATFDYIDFSQLAFYMDERDGGLMIALDIEEAGTLSPLLSIVRDAAVGIKDAEDAVVGFTDQLLDGAFTPEWNDAGNPPLFADWGSRIPMGYTTNRDGGLEDIRNIDIRALSNIQDYDAETIAKLDRGFYDPEVDEERRLSDILSVYREADSTFKHTGYAYRVMVTPEFFELVGDAMKNVRISLQYDGKFDPTSNRRNTRYLTGMGTHSAGIYHRRSAGGGTGSRNSWGRSSQRYSRGR